MQKSEKEWVLNLEAIFDFILPENGRKKVKNTITEKMTGTEKLNVVEKEIKEEKNDDDGIESKIKFDLVKWLIDTMDEIAIDDSGLPDNDLGLIFNALSHKVAFNTLYQYGFLNYTK